MIEMVQGEGVVGEAIENNVNQELDINFEEDILGSLDGRITFAQWMEPPARLNSNVTSLSVKLRDPEKAREVLEKAIDRINRDEDEPNVVSFDYKGFTYWSEPEGRAEERMERIENFRRRRQEDRGEEGVRVNLDVNAQSPGVALVGNSLVFASSIKFLKVAIDTQVGDNPALRDDDDYREISDKLAVMLDNDLPSAIFIKTPKKR